MDDFIFKVPKLPEDACISNRKGNFTRRGRDFENWNDFRGERFNSFQASLFNRRDVFGNQEQLQPLKEDIQEDLPQPSTSQVHQGRGFNGRSNLVNVTVGGGRHHPVFNLVNRPILSQSGQSDRVYGNNINFSSSHNSHHGSDVGLTHKNSFQDKFDMWRGINSFEQRQYLGGNSALEASQSCLMGMRKSVFGTETFPRRNGMEGHITFNESRNNFNNRMSTFDCLTKASTVHKETNTFLNTSQSVLDNQSIMKSVLQISLVSMKEQIMNKLENLGHTLLRNAPGMESSFIQAAKDIRNILENSTLVNPISNATGMMSFVSYSSAAIGPQQRILEGEANKNQSEDVKKPSSILQNLVMKENGSQKIELVKSFTINQKKRDENCDDLSFHECTMTENFNRASRRAVHKKELNLRNWCPIFQKNSLAFTGVTEENIQIKTETVKKRINNRRVLLENGSFCNLIGSPATEKKFPTSLLSCIKNGLTARWKMLAESLANFQQNLKKQKDKIVEEDVSTMECETVSTKTSLKVSNGNTRRKKSKSDEAKSKIENNGKKRSYSPVEKHPVKLQKMDSPKSRTLDEPGVEDGTTERVLCITKSGRIVKRPKDIFSGGNSKENMQPKKINEDEGEEEKEEEKNDQQTGKIKQAAKDARVRKSKEKVKDKEEMKSLNVTLSGETEGIYTSRKATRVKGEARKKVTSKTVKSRNCNTKRSDNPWGNDMDGLDDIIVPNISIHYEEITTDPKKLTLLSMETPPLKNIRSNFAFLKNYTPVQSPDWQTSRHTRSAVKKFEKLRAQAFKTKIPKENDVKKEKISKKTVEGSKDVDTVLNWISEKGIRSPKKCSNIINYIMPKRNKLEDTEEDSELRDEEEM